MSGTGPTLAHRSVASIRSAPTQGPSAPHTPTRTTTSTHAFGSPSAIRADDDVVVIELGSRFIRAGFAGDSIPKATLQCGLEEQRRVGDFRAWQTFERRPGHAWSAEHEIWRYDLRHVDLGLVRDKLDRMLREAFTKYLLIDSRPRRMALVLDSDLPIPLLSAVLDTAFDRFHTPVVSLLSSATMCAAAAGVRSALIVNMGWSETVITSIYEYREVRTTRTVRGGRYLLDELYNKVLKGLVTGESVQENAERVISFEETEDVMCRLMWCRPSAFRSSQRNSAQLETVEEQDELDAEAAPNTETKGTTQVLLASTNPPKAIEVPFEKFADICDDTFFDPSISAAFFDDHELPVHSLIYQHLLQLPMDVRAICMSRIIFTGGCSDILGLKERVLDEVASIVERRGWEPVSGKGADALQRRFNLHSKGESRSSTPSSSETEESTSEVPLTAANTPHDKDPIEAKFQKQRSKPQQVQGQLRALHTLGPWAGASLVCQLKISAIATVDRELWLQQGISGASRPSEIDAKAQQRQSMGAGGLIRGGGGHHLNWTLGVWGNT